MYVLWDQMDLEKYCHPFLLLSYLMKFINKIPEYDESKNMINDKKTIMHK